MCTFRSPSNPNMQGFRAKVCPWESGTPSDESNMADPSKSNKNENFYTFPNEQMPLSSIIPAVQEARKHRPPFIPSVGLPNVIRTPQELMVERVMENCVFKSALAGVVGRKTTTFCFIYSLKSITIAREL